jgi:hypothetical protein
VRLASERVDLGHDRPAPAAELVDLLPRGEEVSPQAPPPQVDQDGVETSTSLSNTS